eukprot:1160087-Pelagomonas_calceolata.AAC.9
MVSAKDSSNGVNISKRKVLQRGWGGCWSIVTQLHPETPFSCKLHAHSVMYANKLVTTRRAIKNKNTPRSQVMEPAGFRGLGGGRWPRGGGYKEKESLGVSGHGRQPA